MSKLLAGILALALMITIVSGWMQGAGGVLAVYVTAPVSVNATQVTVTNTTGWLTADIITIDNEDMSYTAIDATHFKNITRAVDGTSASIHKTGSIAYSEATNAINSSLGFNVAAIGVSNGLYTVFVVPYRFFTTSIPLIISSLDNPMLDGQLVIFRYSLLIVIVSVVVVIAIAIGQVLAYALRR